MRNPACLPFLAVLFVALTIQNGFAETASRRNAQQPQYGPPVSVFVKDMHCATCAKTISSKLYTIKGVAKVQIDLKKNLAVVRPTASTQLSPKAVWEAIELVKFKPIKLVTPTTTYTQKPAK